MKRTTCIDWSTVRGGLSEAVATRVLMDAMSISKNEMVLAYRRSTKLERSLDNKGIDIIARGCAVQVKSSEYHAEQYSMTHHDESVSIMVVPQDESGKPYWFHLSAKMEDTLCSSTS